MKVWVIDSKDHTKHRDKQSYRSYVLKLLLNTFFLVVQRVLIVYFINLSVYSYYSWNTFAVRYKYSTVHVCL